MSRAAIQRRACDCCGKVVDRAESLDFGQSDVFADWQQVRIPVNRLTYSPKDACSAECAVKLLGGTIEKPKAASKDEYAGLLFDHAYPVGTPSELPQAEPPPPDLEEPLEGSDGLPWPETFDARTWAKEFLRTCAKHPSVASDEGAMLSWFANAIMRGHDTALGREQKRRKAESTPTNSVTPPKCPRCNDKGFFMIGSDPIKCDQSGCLAAAPSVVIADRLVASLPCWMNSPGKLDPVHPGTKLAALRLSDGEILCLLKYPDPGKKEPKCQPK